MHPSQWALAPQRKRPRRLAKKVEARLGWKHAAPKKLIALARSMASLSMPSGLDYFLPMVGDKVRPCTLAEFVWFMDRPERMLAQNNVGPFRVSTIFLSVDHGYKLGEPLLWETMVFDGGRSVEISDLRARGVSTDDFDGLMGCLSWRYSTRKEALRNHMAVAASLRKGLS